MNFHNAHYTVEEVKEEIKTKTMNEVAKDHGVSCAALYNFMKLHNIQYLKKRTSGETTKTLASKFGTSETSIRTVYKFLYPEAAPTKGGVGCEKVYTDEESVAIQNELELRQKRRMITKYHINGDTEHHEEVRIRNYEEFFDFDPIPDCLKDEDEDKKKRDEEYMEEGDE